jgi:hypothetical protein
MRGLRNAGGIEAERTGSAEEGRAPGRRTLTQALPVQRKATGPAAASPSEAMEQATAGGGGEVPFRAEMERSFGEGFSSVRAHVGQAAPMAAMEARAAASGEDVAFASATPDRAVVAHELAHVVQQRRAGGEAGTQAKSEVSESGDAAEREADSVAARVTAGETGVGASIGASPTAAIARDSSGAAPAPAGPAPAPAPGVTPPAPAAPGVVTDEKARTDAQAVLSYIKSEAEARAKTPKAIDKSSAFYTRLKDHYLKDYLAKPSAAEGKKATEKIGAPFKGPATPGDRWEEGALGAWNKQGIPEGFRKLRPALPKELAAGTDILSIPNRTKMPYLDVPHLVGHPNTDTSTTEADVKGGGKNISQLMHWATGVKYSDVDPMAMREMFLAYELFHLEGWDIFAEDPINDLISEEAGRIMGTQLQKGEIDATNLEAKLNEGFNEARAWVGSLLRLRQSTFDAWILSEDPAKSNSSNMWWGEIGMTNLWGPDNVFSMLKAGKTVDEVKKWHFTQRVIDIYSLIYEAAVWESTHGKIKNSKFIENMAKGELDGLFAKVTKGEELTLGDKLDAARKVGSN